MGSPHRWEIWGYHKNNDEGLGLAGCDAVSTSNKLPTFRSRMLVPSSKCTTDKRSYLQKICIGISHKNPGVKTCGYLRMRTDRQTDITQLIVAFRNFANAPSNRWFFKLEYGKRNICVCVSYLGTGVVPARSIVCEVCLSVCPDLPFSAQDTPPATLTSRPSEPREIHGPSFRN
jgi:hypothetical protein